MRAERSRALPTRSPSSPNNWSSERLVTRPARQPICKRFELIKPDIRQSPALPGFSFERDRIVSLPTDNPRVMFFPVILRGAILLHLKLCARLREREIFSLSQLDDITLPLCDPKLVGGELP